MRNSVAISLMETTSEVRLQDHLKTTVVLPSNPTPRWKRKFFNHLRFSYWRGSSPPYTSFLLNGDMELHRNR